MIDIDGICDQIMTKALELTPKVDVFEGGVPDNYQPPMLPNSNQIKPYIILDFAALTDSAHNGIVGAASDSYWQMFSAHTVGSTRDTARRVRTMLLNKLLGFVPANCGEIRPAFFAGIGGSSELADPSRFSAAQAFRFLANPV